MDLGLQGKVAIVTGGAAGIGKATVEVFAEEGAIPVIVDKDLARGNEVFDSLVQSGKQGWFYHADLLNDNAFQHADLLNDNACKNVVHKTVEKYGKLDILVNNVGGNDFLPINTTTPQRFRESLNLNLVMPYAMSFYAWPELKKTRGNIVFVGSKVSLVGEGVNGGTIAYAAAKGGVNGLTRELATVSAREDLGIRVNCILPGKVDTYIERMYPGKEEFGRRIQGREIPFGKRLTTPREIANVIVFLASNYVSGHTTGEIWSPDGGYVHLDRLAHLPQST